MSRTFDEAWQMYKGDALRLQQVEMPVKPGPAMLKMIAHAKSIRHCHFCGETREGMLTVLLGETICSICQEEKAWRDDGEDCGGDE